MKAEYRNSLRSKELIKQAFLSLLKEKKLNKITVTDIVKKANISRGTFYAHYQDTYDFIDIHQKEYIDQLSLFMQNYPDASLVERLDILLNLTFTTLEKNIDIFCILAKQDFPFSFYTTTKNALIIELIRGQDINDQIVCTLNIYLSGFIMIIREWLENPEFDKLQDIKETLSALAHQGTF